MLIVFHGGAKVEVLYVYAHVAGYILGVGDGAVNMNFGV